jgi:hypothetical protein
MSVKVPKGRWHTQKGLAERDFNEEIVYREVG